MNEQLRRVVIVPFLAFVFLVTAGLLVHNAYVKISQSPEVGKALGTGVRVKVAEVTSRQYLDVFGATGEASPSKLLPIRKAKGSGADLAQTIDRIHVSVGDFVNEGDLLISFDNKALNTRIEAEQSSNAALDSDLAELEKREGFRRRELRAAVRTSQASVKSGQSALARDEANLKRRKNLYEEGLISLFDYEKARSARDLAEFNLRQSEEELLHRKNELSDLNARLSAERQRLIAEARSMKSDLVATQEDLANAEIRAQWPGLVVDLPVYEGGMVMTGESLVKVGQIDPIHTITRVPQEMINRVFVGQQTEVVYDAIPYETYKGEVIHVDPAVDRGSATFRVSISISNTDTRIHPGMSGFVRFRNQRTAMVIPQMAITGSGSDTAVFVVNGKTASLQHVQVGEVVDVGFVEILGGLEPGQNIVVHGLKDLQNGDPIKVVAN